MIKNTLLVVLFGLFSTTSFACDLLGKDPSTKEIIAAYNCLSKNKKPIVDLESNCKDYKKAILSYEKPPHGKWVYKIDFSDKRFNATHPKGGHITGSINFSCKVNLMDWVTYDQTNRATCKCMSGVDITTIFGRCNCNDGMYYFEGLLSN